MFAILLLRKLRAPAHSFTFRIAPSVCLPLLSDSVVKVQVVKILLDFGPPQAENFGNLQSQNIGSIRKPGNPDRNTGFFFAFGELIKTQVRKNNLKIADNSIYELGLLLSHFLHLVSTKSASASKALNCFIFPECLMDRK